jgi:hypothetical protein
MSGQDLLPVLGGAGGVLPMFWLLDVFVQTPFTRDVEEERAAHPEWYPGWASGAGFLLGALVGGVSGGFLVGRCLPPDGWGWPVFVAGAAVLAAAFAGSWFGCLAVAGDTSVARSPRTFFLCALLFTAVLQAPVLLVVWVIGRLAGA